MTAKCYDCAISYGDEYGFPDLIVPDDVWLAISPNGDFSGLLCPNCICRRLYEKGMQKVEARFMSGPLANFYDYEWTPRPNDTLAPRRHISQIQEEEVKCFCDRPWDQEEPRFCPECQKYKSTCANDHCLECGANT